MKRMATFLAVTAAAVLTAANASAAPAPNVAPAAAGIPQGKWTGTSTNTEGTFNYGKVSFTVASGAVTKFTIAGVTVSGCGGYMSIVVPRIPIKGKSFSGSYVPVKGIDQTVTVSGRLTGAQIKGTFKSGPTCVGAGRFTATLG